MKCPPPLVLFQFAQGTVGPDLRGAIEAHVTTCGTCAGHVEQARRSQATRRRPTSPPAVPRPRSEPDGTRNLGPVAGPDFDDDSATSIHSVGPQPSSAIAVAASPEDAITVPPPGETRRRSARTP